MPRSPEQFGERSVNREKAERHLQEDSDVRYLLETQAERLRSEGLPVNAEARLHLDDFWKRGAQWDVRAYAKRIGAAPRTSDQTIREMISRKLKEDMRTASHLQKKFQLRREEGKDADYNNASAELLEIMKTASAPQWLGEDFVVVRTSRYDDYVNGVDEIIVHRESRQPFAAIDTTLNKEKLWRQAVGENRHTIAEVVKWGASVDHGISLADDGEFRLGPLNDLPMFVVSLDEERVLGWADRAEKSTASERATKDREAAILVLHDLLQQSKEARRIADDNLGSRYEDIGDFFSKRLKELEV